MSPTPARVLRFAPTEGETAFGLVLETCDGTPTRIFNLTAHRPSLGGGFKTFRAEGFALAAEIWQTWQDGEGDESLTIDITPEQVLAPIDITSAQREAEDRFVISIGLNFQAHRAETKRAVDLMMVKPVDPTPAYQNHTMQPAVELLDHEAELACVLLEDIDLDAIPPMADLEKKLAFMTVNDLTDRGPIIRDDVHGFTEGKSDRSFLPLGPWMVHGAALPVFTESMGLAITCAVKPRGGEWRERQRDVTTNLIRNPEAILRLLADKLNADPDMHGRDREGHAHAFARRRGDNSGFVIPAGSLLLTGTPGGTCIRMPSLLHRMKLFLLGGLSMKGARRRYVCECKAKRTALGYLQSGDAIETAVEHLGKQRWEITS